MKRFGDSVFEALFHQAIIDDYNEEIDAIPPKEELMEIVSFSPEFEMRMKKLFAREQWRDFLRKAFRFCKRAATVFAITATVLFGMLLFNSEVIAAAKNTIVEWYDKFTSFIFQGEASESNEKKEWQPEYLPAGYDERSAETLGKAINITYDNYQGNTILLSFRPGGNGTSILVDNENHLLENRTINGHEAYIAKAIHDDFENGVIWSMEGYTFSLWSKLPIDELIRIAKSISCQD